MGVGRLLSFFPSTIKLWNSLPDSVKSLPTFSKFKKAIQPVQIPVASFYNIGDRKTNIIHTKLKHRCSGLNSDLYRVNLKNDPRCVCDHLFEDTIHFFLECPLYQHGRTSLFNYFNNIVPISIEYILFVQISAKMQKFIRQACRFNNYYPQP